MLKQLKIYWPVLFVLVFYFFATFFYLSFHDWNISSFVVFGQENTIYQYFANEDLYLYDSGLGFDGQFYYLFSRHPFNFDLINQILEFPPSFVYQRIIYPLLVFLLSGFGNPFLVELMLVLVNLFAILLSTFVLIKIFAYFNVSQYYSLLYPLYPGVVSAYFFNLTEPLAYLFVIIATYFSLKDKYLKSAFFLVLAVLTKEVTIIIAFSFFLYCLFFRKSNFLYYFFPLASFGLWWFILHLFIFPDSNYLSVVNFDFGPPLYGFYQKFVFSPPISLIYWAQDIMFLLFFALGIIFILYNLFTKINLYNFSAGFYCVVALTFSYPLLLFPKEYTRHYIGFFLFLILTLSVNRLRKNQLVFFVYVFYLLLFYLNFFVFGNFFNNVC